MTPPVPSVHFSSRSDGWATPWPFFRALDAEFGFTVDAAALPENAKCARFFTPADDGLRQDWAGEVVWLNPPYGRGIGEWVAKAAAEAGRGATVVCLLPARTDTAWWNDAVMRPGGGVRAEVRLVRGRLRFGGGLHPAPFPIAVVVFRPPDPGVPAGRAAERPVPFRTVPGTPPGGPVVAKKIQGLGAQLVQAVDVSPPTALRPSPVAVLLDVSGSMLLRVAALLAGLRALREQFLAQPKGRAAELLVVTFGREVKVLADFVPAADWQPPAALAADGETPVGRAIETALDALDKREEHYAAAELLPNTPQLFIFGDGVPEGEAEAEVARARDRLLAAQRDRRVYFTACAVGDPDGRNDAFLTGLSAAGKPPRAVAGDQASFAEAFAWVTQAVVGRPAAAPTQKGFLD